MAAIELCTREKQNNSGTGVVSVPLPLSPGRKPIIGVHPARAESTSKPFHPATTCNYRTAFHPRLFSLISAEKSRSAEANEQSRIALSIIRAGKGMRCYTGYRGFSKGHKKSYDTTALLLCERCTPFVGFAVSLPPFPSDCTQNSTQQMCNR